MHDNWKISPSFSIVFNENLTLWYTIVYHTIPYYTKINSSNWWGAFHINFVLGNRIILFKVQCTYVVISWWCLHKYQFLKNKQKKKKIFNGLNINFIIIYLSTKDVKVYLLYVFENIKRYIRFIITGILFKLSYNAIKWWMMRNTFTKHNEKKKEKKI